MTNIQRKDFKYNFLKNIIIRFDFQGVFEPELENILPDIKPYLKEKNFTRYNKRNDNTINININDMQPPIFNNFQNQIIHSFVNDDSGYMLDISNNFICLNIRSTTYSPFEEYAKLISDIIKIYKEKIDFFTITRIGIRKINVNAFHLIKLSILFLAKKKIVLKLTKKIEVISLVKLYRVKRII